MTRGNNRHELLVVLTPGHFIVIFNNQECGIKEKAYVSESGRCRFCLNVCQISELLVFYKRRRMPPPPKLIVRMRHSG